MTVRIYPTSVAIGSECIPVYVQYFDLRGDLTWFPNVVTIEERDEFTTGTLNTAISCGALTLIILVNDAYSWFELRKDIATFIRRTIVYSDDFNPRIGLRKRGLNRKSEVSLSVKNRDNNRN